MNDKEILKICEKLVQSFRLDKSHTFIGGKAIITEEIKDVTINKVEFTPYNDVIISFKAFIRNKMLYGASGMSGQGPSYIHRAENYYLQDGRRTIGLSIIGNNHTEQFIMKRSEFEGCEPYIEYVRMNRENKLTELLNNDKRKS